MKKLAVLGGVLVLAAVFNSSPSTPEFKEANFKPRGLRNRNPFNIKINKANNWAGKVPVKKNTDKVFEQFYDFTYGIRAGLVLLRNYIKAGHNTIEKIITRLAPASENNTKAYIAAIERVTGFERTEVITLSRPALISIAWAIIKHENGQEIDSDEITAVYDKFFK